MSILFFFVGAAAYSQALFTGEILSSNLENIFYVKGTLKNRNHAIFSDTAGKFEIKSTKATDTLYIPTYGYQDTLVTKSPFDSPLKIQLKEDISTRMEELVISVSGIRKERWINFFGNKTGKFRKKLYRNKYFDVQLLKKGYPVMNEFIIPDTITVTSFTVYTQSRRTETITLRPIILKNSSSLHYNLVSDEIVRAIMSSSSKSETEPVPITFNFNKSITFFPGDKINLGLELVDSDYSGSQNLFPFHLICYNKEQIPMSFVSTRKNIDIQVESTGNEKLFFKRPFYFELKVVE